MIECDRGRELIFATYDEYGGGCDQANEVYRKYFIEHPFHRQHFIAVVRELMRKVLVCNDDETLHKITKGEI